MICGENHDCLTAAASVCDTTVNTCTTCTLNSDCTLITDKPRCNAGTCGILI